MARVALVTGGSRGIGAEISRALAAQGRTVIANYGGNEAAAEAFRAATGIPVVCFDVGDFEACKAGVDGITQRFGPIEILVNNAGITRDGTLARMSRDMWDAVIDTNLGSCYNLCKLTFDGMRERKFGRIVNVGSINGQAGQYGQVNYAAAKSGIHGFTKALAQEGARYGITVNAIAPGYVDTEMVRAVPADVLAKIVARIPVGRLGYAEDIARGVAFLTADEAGFVTGSTLSINGGQHMYLTPEAAAGKLPAATDRRAIRISRRAGPSPRRPSRRRKCHAWSCRNTSTLPCGTPCCRRRARRSRRRHTRSSPRPLSCSPAGRGISRGWPPVPGPSGQRRGRGRGPPSTPGGRESWTTYGISVLGGSVRMSPAARNAPQIAGPG